MRPTPDRVRETLFNWLGQDLTGASTLELYAGTGVLSLEALSRGAALSVAVDRNAHRIGAISQAARAIGIAGLEAHIGDALRFIQGERRRFDVVFLDPPFSDDPWRELFDALPARLTQSGRVYAEAGQRLEPPAHFEILRRGKAGSVHYHLLAPTTSATHP